ncbi:probable FRS2 - phenylalanine--tRNA ligase beta chain, cytosolic [Melanopsichium pennsylvanicum]|uniref:phenylalanine--tRNA ligase n=2 Tax=Melanopsichium pennsylvanicum TaxID=63383 RepID=A0AAJ5C4D6_9BASI|nr:probable FRS2-phenylalanine--tRNA ligase beta chain, cytosolic [Melanopsichium pennsylvanicum 4]SNX83369.1 probable FRS2 - phenylalanine--tRNA ligase beta chain, cytosolic [Melanopsichium pennsylvanicum]
MSAPQHLIGEPTAESVLAALDSAPNGVISDTRTIAPIVPTTQSNSATDPAARSSANEAVFKARAQWQLALSDVLKSLVSREMVVMEKLEETTSAPLPDGFALLQNGSPEIRLVKALPNEEGKGRNVNELKDLLGAEVLKNGQSNAFRNKWAKKLPDGSFGRTEATLGKSDAELNDEIQEQIAQVLQTGTLPGTDAAAVDKKLAELRKRKLVATRKLVYFSITKGPQFSLTVQKLETDLTFEMLQSGSWQTAPFKKYNFNAEGALQGSGALHPLLKVREEFRNIFFEMGFTEMATDRFVESSFWCFDSLFVPQQHPARDVQDTFFIKDPPYAKRIDEEYLKRVTQVHQEGGFGSVGYRYPFDRKVTEKLVLRTHTTAVSSAMLYKLANQPGGFKPAKLFSIDRVFRNEAVDATHLAEFHQVEGVVADYNITLGDLIGFMEVFFKKMGVTNLRFKPAYNPYTEPSLEIFSYHQGLGKWVEVGNSGMFRPEMLRPMGLPEGVNVLGWGLSLERPTMIRYAVKDIRELVGHKVPISSVENAPATRF